MAEMMTLARPYAKAAFDYAQGSQRVADWSQALSIASQVSRDPQMSQFLATPGRSPAQLTEVMMQAVGLDRTRAGDFYNLLQLMAENGRLALLPQVAFEFERLKARQVNEVPVVIETAFPLTQAQELLLTSRLEKRFGSVVKPTVIVRPDLMAGVVIRAGDQVIDDSAMGRLHKLRNHLMAS